MLVDQIIHRNHFHQNILSVELNMAQRNHRNLEYVNVPKTAAASAISKSDKNLLRLALLSCGLLCILQATINVTLRIVIYYSDANKAEINGICVNSTHLSWQYLDKYFQEGWLLFDTSLYYISTEQRSWQDSRRFCLQREADLIVINSIDEQEFTRKFHRFMWLGLSNMSMSSWTWVDGTPLTTSYWGPDEPNNGLYEVCVEARFFEITNSWNNENCEAKAFWICEKKLSF